MSNKYECVESSCVSSKVRRMYAFMWSRASRPNRSTQVSTRGERVRAHARTIIPHLLYTRRSVAKRRRGRGLPPPRTTHHAPRTTHASQESCCGPDKQVVEW